MAREHGKLRSAFWRDPDAIAMTHTAQWLFMFFISQPNLTLAGVLPLAVRRWVTCAVDMDESRLVEALGELERHRFVVVDLDTEEVLVRSFARLEVQWANPKSRNGFLSAAASIWSPRIHGCLASELRRLPEVLSDQPRVAELVARWDAKTAERTAERSAERTAERSAEVSHEAVLRGETGEGRRERGLSEGSAPRAAEAVNSTDRLIAEWLEACRHRPPGNVIGHVGKQIKAMLAEGIDPDHIRGGLARFAAKPMHPSTLPSLVNEAMNARPGPAGVVGASPSRNAQILARAMERAQAAEGSR